MILRDIILETGYHVNKFDDDIRKVQAIGVGHSFDDEIIYFSDIKNILSNNEIFGSYRIWRNNYRLVILDKYEIMLLDYIDSVELVENDGTYSMFPYSTLDDNHFITACDKLASYWSILHCLIVAQQCDTLSISDNSFILVFNDSKTYKYNININKKDFIRFLIKAMTLSKKC